MRLKVLVPLGLTVAVTAGCASPQADTSRAATPDRVVGVKPAVGVANGPIRVMPLGASVTWGSRSRDGNGYRQVLLRRLFAAGINAEFVGSRRSGSMGEKQNEGHPGFRIDQIAAGADRWLAEARPSVVLLNVGTNDMIQNHDVADAPERMHALIDEILAARPGCKVLVSTLIPSPLAARNERTDAFNAQLPGIVAAERRAGRQVYLVDLNGALTTGDIGPDHIHPTEAGYRKIANAWFTVLAPLLHSEKVAAAAGKPTDAPSSPPPSDAHREPIH